jgi:hypothetical protein
LCSIVAANRQGDLDLVFLENRDRPKELFTGNDVRKIDEVVGIYDFRSRGMAAGYSLESETAGGVANILGYSGPKSRGLILLQALQNGKSAKDAARIIESEVAGGDYSSATYVVCDTKNIINIENFGKKVHVANNERKRFVVTTNHFRHLEKGVRLENSVLREKYLKTLGVMTEEGVLKLATRHRNPSICRHGKTLSSFAVFKKHDDTLRILYSTQEPCKGFKKFRVRRN